MLRWVYFPGTTCPRITLPFRPYIGRLFILIRSRAKFFYTANQSAQRIWNHALMG
jgi:hypothetical protein